MLRQEITSKVRQLAEERNKALKEVKEFRAKLAELDGNISQKQKEYDALLMESADPTNSKTMTQGKGLVIDMNSLKQIRKNLAPKKEELQKMLDRAQLELSGELGRIFKTIRYRAQMALDGDLELIVKRMEAFPRAIIEIDRELDGKSGFATYNTKELDGNVILAYYGDKKKNRQRSIQLAGTRFCKKTIKEGEAIMDETSKIIYPEMDEVKRKEEEEKRAALEGENEGKTAAEVLYPPPEEKNDYELGLNDPETGELRGALDLFENEEYQELADLVGHELTALQVGPEEIGLFNYDKKMPLIHRSCLFGLGRLFTTYLSINVQLGFMVRVGGKR